MKKNNNKMYWILGIAFLILFYYLSTQGFFKSTVNVGGSNYLPASPDVIVQLERPPTTTEPCTLSITPQAVFTGDSITGIIQDGKNTRCDVYADIEGWKLIYSGTTDNNGRLSSTQNIEITGTFTFKALCGSCITNDAILYVNPLPTTTCSDRASAGGYFYKEPVMTPFDCNKLAIDECEKKGLQADVYNLDRSYCCLYKCKVIPTTPCTDTDGINKNAPGMVTIGGINYLDECTATMMVKEYICNGNVLGSTLLYCDAGTTCVDSPIGDFCSPGLPPPSCNTKCISKGFVSGRGPFSSGSSCTGTEVIEYLVGNAGDICCCLPSGGNEELPMTAPECDAWRISLGKTSYTLTTTSELDCQDFAWNNCNSLGLIVKYYDFQPNCCIWSCMEM